MVNVKYFTLAVVAVSIYSACISSLQAKRLSDRMAEDISFISIFGIYLPNKAEGLKNWSGTGCDVKSVGVTDATATMLSPDVGILTFKATADGTCFGQKVGLIRSFIDIRKLRRYVEVDLWDKRTRTRRE